ARKILNELLDRSTREHVQSLYFSYVCMGLGQFDEALAWLQKSYEARDQYLIVIGKTWDPAFEQVQDDPRFKAIVQRIVESTL
ncbi:MAG: hypothetical protein P8181_00585, partial [bacterium]